MALKPQLQKRMKITKGKKNNRFLTKRHEVPGLFVNRDLSQAESDRIVASINRLHANLASSRSPK